jgi:hypothetical protein
MVEYELGHSIQGNNYLHKCHHGKNHSKVLIRTKCKWEVKVMVGDNPFPKRLSGRKNVQGENGLRAEIIIV